MDCVFMALRIAGIRNYVSRALSSLQRDAKDGENGAARVDGGSTSTDLVLTMDRLEMLLEDAYTHGYAEGGRSK
jgi:hypothetical protein